MGKSDSHSHKRAEQAAFYESQEAWAVEWTIEGVNTLDARVLFGSPISLSILAFAA
jgi:hypothetical protein